jgi:hypothetical protein
MDAEEATIDGDRLSVEDMAVALGKRHLPATVNDANVWRRRPVSHVVRQSAASAFADGPYTGPWMLLHPLLRTSSLVVGRKGN